MSNYERLLKPAFDLTICIFLSITAFTLYFFTLPLTVLWGDNAGRLMSTYDISLTTHLGAYPLPIIIAKFFRQLTHLNPAYSHNLLSAIIMAFIVITIFYLTVIIITNSRFSAIIATFAVMVSHTFWLVSIINESYPFHLLFLNILLLLIILWIKTKKQKYLYIFSFVFGLSFFSGYSSLLMLPAIIFVLWKRKDVFRPRILLYIFVLGFLPWIYCLIADMIRQVPLKGFVFWFKKFSICAQFLRAINPKDLLPELLRYPFYLFYQFPLIGFLLGFFAIMRVKKDEIITLIFILFLTEVIYGSGYYYQRHFYVYVFSYVTFAIFIGLGTKLIEINKNLHFKITFASLMVILPLLLYSIAPSVIPKGYYHILKIRDIPYRDNLKYFLQPSKRGYRGTYEYAKNALEQVKKGDTIIGDYTIVTVLEYFNKIEKIGDGGINLVFDERLTYRGIRIPEYVRDRVGKGVNVFLADNEDFYCIEELKKEYEIIPSGVLYKIVPKK